MLGRSGNFSANLIHLVKRTGVHRMARRFAPAQYEKVKDYYSIKTQVSEGYSLVDLPEVEREYRKAIRWMLESVGPDAIGDYLEFGVFYGSSLACMHRLLKENGLKHVRLFGFDSFEGLPPSDHPDDSVWGPGEFRSDYKFAKEFLTKNGVDWGRVILEKGWFSDTCTPEFRARHRLTKASFIMIDCDMYLSAKQALDFCAALVQDHAIVFFDDWNSGGFLAERGQGEKRAFDELLAANPRLVAEEFGAYNYKGRPHAKVFKVSVKR